MSQRPGTPFDRPTDLSSINPFDRRSPFEKEYDQMIKNKENREKRDEAMQQVGRKVREGVMKTGVTTFAGGLGGSIAGAKVGGAVGGPVGAVVGSLAGGMLGEKVGEGVGKIGEKKMAGEAMRTEFGGGAITGDSADRRSPTEEMVMGNPMASPFAADSVRMPQDLQAGYMHMNRFGSPLPIHGLGTPGRTTMAQDIQDGNLVMQHRMQVANRDPVSMSRLNMIGGMGDFS